MATLQHVSAVRRGRSSRVIAVLAASMVLTLPSAVAAQDVTEGETTIVSVRETDARLGPLVTTLVGLGIASLLATVVFWWLTRPSRLQERTLDG